MEKLKFYVAALAYHKGDAGRMYLHKLAHHIQQLGEDVTIIVDDAKMHPDWDIPYIQSPWHMVNIPHDNSVAIYPEICSTGNPFNAELCVRWVLGNSWRKSWGLPKERYSLLMERRCNNP